MNSERSNATTDTPAAAKADGGAALSFGDAEALLQALAEAPEPSVPTQRRPITPAEAQLRKAEARYRTLVEEIPAVTFLAALDEGLNELYVSPQIEQLLGFSQKEWLEDPVLWHRQLHPEDRERWNRQFAPTCASGTPFKEVYRFRSKKGKDVWVLGSASVVRDADGQPSFLQGVAFDITS